MKIQRTMPPAAAMISFMDLFHGITGALFAAKYLAEAEKEIKACFGVRHVFLTSSGKAALTLILRALQSLSPEKREVLIPAYTCYSVPSAIIKAGLKVSLCDINPRTFDFDHALLEGAISDKTLCIVPTHLFGVPADVERVKNMSRRRGIYVVEDAAQAMGGGSRGRKLGAVGDVGFFSLGRGKNITCGSGGIVVTNDDRIAGAMMKEYVKLEQPGVRENCMALIEQLAMKIFLHPNLYWLPAGIPSLKLGRTIFYRDFPVKKLSGVKAGLLRNWRRRLAAANHIRKETGEFYQQELMRGATGQGIAYLRFPFLAGDRETRDRIYLRAKKYGISRMYPSPINEIPDIREQFQGRAYPAAKNVAERMIALPAHRLLSEEDKRNICHAVQDNNVAAKKDHVLITNVTEGQGA